MKIGISTRGLNQGSHAIATIILNLTRHIIHRAPQSHELILYFNDPRLETLFDPAVNKRSIKLNNRFIWDQLWLPAALYYDKVDIALFMKGTMPVLLPCKGAVIFHDLGYFDTALKPYRVLETIYMKNMMTWAAKNAAMIFSDSEYTRQEAIKILGIETQKIRVCYPTCSPIFKPVTEQEALDPIKRRYSLPHPFIFCPVTLSPRKNIPRILGAFETVKERIPHHLVITGGQSWGVNRQDLLLGEVFDKRVHVLGTVPQEHMPALYSMASFTLYPSLIEGFGVPILEAFHCGCPVLTSNVTAMPEIAGEAAYLVNPFDQYQIAEGMLKLALDGNYREELIRKGFARTACFTWENAARILLQGLLG